MRNAISIDVEEYFHAANLEAVAGPARWHALPRRADDATRKILDLFDRYETKATFFVLGYVAARNPSLVREIATRGHEVASHGYAHRTAYLQTPKQFLRDVHRSKRLLEDLTGREVIGYRAPSFSITDQNLWAYDSLIQSGYRYDSSLYPVRHSRYGNAGKPLVPFFVRREFGAILVLPLAVSPFSIARRELRVPVAGGAYWRIFPKRAVRWALRRINHEGDHPFICYFHPWELDPGQPYFSELPFLTRLRHYTGLSTFTSTIEFYLRSFSFDSIQGCYINDDRSLERN